LLPPKQIWTLGLLCLPFILAITTSFVFVRRLNELAYDYRPWSWRFLLLKFFPIPMLSFLTVFTCFRLLPALFRRRQLDDRHSFRRSVLRGFIGALIMLLPVILYISVATSIDKTYSKQLFTGSTGNSTPSICSYFYALGGRNNHLTHSVLLRFSDCLQTYSLAKVFTEQHFSLLPEFLALGLTLCIFAAFLLEDFCFRLQAALEEQLVQLSMEPFNFVSDNWNRLDVSSVFLCFWLIKLFLIVLLGAAFWPIDAKVIELLSRATDEHGVPIKHSLNFTFLTAYANENGLLSSNNLSYRLFSRFLTGALAIGAETWTSVYGAAVCVGLLSGFVVNFLAFCVDPLGANIAQLIQTAEIAPVAANPWIPIEEQLTSNEHIEVTAVELLQNTSWSCVILFVFLAIQYDLPNLTSHQRIFCFTHLLIVMGFTCVYPVESLVKAILLRLGLPGLDSPWIDHLIPLLFCVLMIGLSGCVFIHFPVWLSYLPYTGRGYQPLGGKPSLTDAAGGVGGGTISAYTGYAQRLRTYLCGGQLLLDVTCTLFEYALHQAHHRWPLWTRFHSLLAASRLFNIFINYLISLLSVLVILWLIFYESFGVCRVFILIVHVFFVLYPATCRGFFWLRTQLFLKDTMASIPAPTSQQLDAYADWCAICYEAMSVGNAKRTLCGHMFHSKCLMQWVQRRPICPMCNADIFASPQFCPVRLSTARPPLRVNPGCDLVYESANAEPINQPAKTHQEASNETKNSILTPRLPGKHMSITFTCNVCKTRTQKFFSKLAYTRGLVIIRCPSCQSLHLIADNLGWIKEKTPW
uniref:RING-type domain-containing protein n=1 Tax=Hydatigena taeniaeformis TaxID=6205 RepID=A0A0R3WZA4_HYDTA